MRRGEREPRQARSGRGFGSRRSVLLTLGVLLLFLIVTYAVVLNALRPQSSGRELGLDELNVRVADKNITEATLKSQDSRLVGTDDRGPWWVSMGDNEILTARLLQELPAAGVRTRVDSQVSKSLLRLSTNFALPSATFVVGFAFLYALFRNRGDGAGRDLTLLGRSKPRRYASAANPPVTFRDIAGLEEAIDELREVKEFLAAPERFEAMGARPPRGILLAGPPGCGKTLLARAVAGEAGVPFFSISGSEFVEILVGVGPARVRDLFEKARAAAPSIVFVDELDAIGRSRSADDNLSPEWNSTLNELLVQLDGFDAAKRVVLMAATNRPDILDQALVRKGRFDRHIVIDAPDYIGRLAIAKVHARGKPLGSDLDLERFARRTVGLTGADIAAALNEAAMLAARSRRPSIGTQELDEAIDRVLAGPERHSRVLSPADKRRVAYHEAGHALVGWVLNTSAVIDKVSIVARGHNLGGTWNLPLDDRRLVTRTQMEEDMALALAGRAAENIVFADPSAGAQKDLVKALQLARTMVYEFGMTKSLAPVLLGAADGSMRVHEHAAETVLEADRELQELLQAADGRARAVITAYRSHLDELAEVLAARETLERSDLEHLLAELPKGMPPAPSAARKASAARRVAQQG